MLVSQQDFFDIFTRHKGFVKGKIKLKKPRELQQVLDVSQKLISELKYDDENLETLKKLEQLRSVLQMFEGFSGINRKVQMKLVNEKDKPETARNLLLIVKWGGELTPAGKLQGKVRAWNEM